MKRIKLLVLLGMMQINALQAVESIKDNCCKGPVLCPTSPVLIEGGCDLRMHIDIGLLYQSPQYNGAVAGISYAPQFEASFAGSDDWVYQTETNLNRCFPYVLGVTASLGRYIEHDDFYLGARFDWLHATTSMEYDTNDTSGYELRPNSNLNLAVTEGTAFDPDEDTLTKIFYNGEFEFYQLDLLLSRGSYHSKSFSYEPFAGIKALWYEMDQKTSNYSTDFTGGNYLKWHEHQESWGAGPMFGFNALYHFTCKLALFSDSDIALLYGESRLKNISTLVGEPGAAVTVDQVIDHFNNDNCQFYVPLRTILGVQLSDYCFDNRHYLAIKVGFDVRTILAYPTDVRGFSMGGVFANLVWNF